jgi:DNA-binding NtrC family response regulator
VAFKWLLPASMAATPSFNERSCTILVVEDEALIRHTLYIVLKRMGHVVLEARDGAEGLTVSRNFNGRIDLVIADVQMPKVDAPTMVRLLHAKRPGMKVLLISGDSAESVPNDWMKNFLHKPFPPATIEQKVQEMLSCDQALGIRPSRTRFRDESMTCKKKPAG